MDNDLVSIIVPTYNNGEYIERCLRSLIKQNYLNLQIIVINDGSSDNTLQICEKFALKDSRIEVISQGRRGVAASRNTGINLAKGKYIMFVDGDDYVSPDFCSSAVDEAEKYGSDMVIFNYFCVRNNDILKQNIGNNNGLISKEYAIELATKFSFLPMRLIKRELFDGITFPQGRLYEDLFICYKLTNKAKKISLSDNYTYYYVQHDNSITHFMDSDHLADMFRARIEINDFLEKNYSKVAQKELYLLYHSAFFYHVYEKHDTRLKKIAKKIIYNNKVPQQNGRKFYYAMVCYKFFPKLTGKLIKKYLRNK